MSQTLVARFMFRKFVVFLFQYFSELWNITLLVLCTEHNILSCVKVYPRKENQTKKDYEKENLI